MNKLRDIYENITRIRSIVKYTLKKLNAMMWDGSIGVRINVEGPGKHRNEALLFEKAENFFSV